MNSSGKVIVTFIVIFTILLISSTAVSLFFWKEEMGKREKAEEILKASQDNELKVSDELKEIKKQNFILEEKNKELDEKINALMDELDLEAGLKEQMKQELAKLKTEVETSKAEKEKYLTQIQETENKIVALEENLKKEIERNKELTQANINLEQNRARLENETKEPAVEESVNKEQAEVAESQNNVDLEPIVIAPTVDVNQVSSKPKEIPEGRILTVDVQAEFVIVNLGSKDGVASGDIMSVYRGQDYLGDIKVTRVQPEMFAADFMPPFSSESVRKNDQVVAK